MNQETFQIFLWVMSAVALAVFIALYFVKAGYGMFRTASWGISINNKLAWVLMEAPVFIVMFGLWGKSGAGFSIPVYLFFLLFQLHYLQRAFVFPFLLKGKSRMPVAIMAMGIVFNLLNGMMQAGGLFYFAPEGLYADGCAYLLKPHALLGIILFFAGMLVNLHSDYVIRHLRKPGDTKHYLPGKGLYRYVTSANYFSIITIEPLQPGTEPLIKRRLCSGITFNTCKLCVVTRSPPIWPPIRIPLNTFAG